MSTITTNEKPPKDAVYRTFQEYLAAIEKPHRNKDRYYNLGVLVIEMSSSEKRKN